MIVGAFILGAAIIGLVWPRGPKEPVYQGKRFGEWVIEAYCDSGPERMAAARNAVQAIGTNALPWLMAEFTRPEPKWRKLIYRWTVKLSPRQPDVPPEVVRIEWAAAGLEMLGSNVTPVLPELAQHLSHPLRANWAARAMAAAGDSALPWLVQGLATADPIAGPASAKGLLALAYRLEAAVPPLVQALQSTNAETRWEVAFGLRQIRLRPELVVPAVAAAQSDPDIGIAEMAAQTLAFMRGHSPPLSVELRQLMVGTNAASVRAASNALHLLETPNSPPRDHLP